MGIICREINVSKVIILKIVKYMMEANNHLNVYNAIKIFTQRDLNANKDKIHKMFKIVKIIL